MRFLKLVERSGCGGCVWIARRRKWNEVIVEPSGGFVNEL